MERSSLTNCRHLQEAYTHEALGENLACLPQNQHFLNLHKAKAQVEELACLPQLQIFFSAQISVLRVTWRQPIEEKLAALFGMQTRFLNQMMNFTFLI